MKNSLCIFTLLLCLTAGLTGCEHRHDKWVDETHRLRDEAGRRICKELTVQQGSSGGGLMGGLNHVSLGFITDAEWTRDQARRNILVAIDILVASLNSSDEVKAHSVANPIGPAQVEISIIYMLPKNEGAGPIGVVRTDHNGEISYKSLLGSSSPFEILHRESVNEARALVKAEK